MLLHSFACPENPDAFKDITSYRVSNYIAVMTLFKAFGCNAKSPFRFNWGGGHLALKPGVASLIR